MIGQKIKISQLPKLTSESISIDDDLIHVIAKAGTPNYGGYVMTVEDFGNFVGVNTPARNALSASYAEYAEIAGTTISSSFADEAFIADFVRNVRWGDISNIPDLVYQNGDAILNNVTASSLFVDEITANQFNVSVTQSSVMYISGSNKFGDSDDDIHQFTGSVDITGSLTLNGEPITNILTASVFYDSTLDPNLAMLQDVGGIEAGTTVGELTGSTFTELFDELLFPTVYPTFVNPSLTSFDDGVSQLQEIGDSINLSFTANFDRGQILIDSIEQNKRSGVPNTYTYTGTGLPSSVSSILTTDNQSVNNYLVIQGYQDWSCNVAYDEGPQPLDNKGNNFNSPLPAGISNTRTTRIEGVYPLFATITDITIISQLPTLYSMITSPDIDIDLVAEVGGIKQTFDIPNVFSSITGIRTLNTTTGDFEYQAGSGGNGLGKWTTAAVTQIVQGNAVNYTRYTYNGVDRGSITIRLEF